VITLDTVFNGFSGSKGWIGKTIRFLRGGDINHEFCVYWDRENGGWTVRGADTRGWMETPAEDLRKNQTVRLYAAPEGYDLRKGIAALKSLLGARYDVGGLIGMVWVLAMRKVFGKRVHNPLARRKSLYCSEIQDKVRDESGINLGLDESSTDPLSSEEALKAWSDAQGRKFTGPYTLDEMLAVTA
jgi:hypothetical protein